MLIDDKHNIAAKLLILVIVVTIVTTFGIVLTEAKNSTTVTATTTEKITTDICESTEPEEPSLSKEEIELIALVTMAEAEGESEEGKRLVIDTVLNRVDSEYWPDTVSEVIYQPGQFTSMWNGRVDRCYVSEDICRLVTDELNSRTNYDVVYFTAGAYGRYGKPMFQVGNHYFASYD